MATANKAFRARAFDSNRSMTVYWGHELPDLSECSVGNRAVTQMPSGMEKEEEMESHLQDAILAQQASTSGVQVNHVIPTPKVDRVEDERYHSTYHNRNQKRREKFIKVHAWQALERDEPEYDYDTEDETWLESHPHIEARILEKVFDTVENHSSETQVASEESVINFHKSLDSSIVYEVYEYWVTKRITAASTSGGNVGVGGLIPRVRTECRKDAQGAVNPYVAFRRRAEKMQTRKNRKNDEDSYEKILKLMHDMSKAQQLFDMTARREKQKLALLDVESEILMKRLEMSDFGATNAFAEISNKLKVVSENTKPLQEINSPEDGSPKKKKRVRRKVGDKDLVSKAWLKKNAESWNRPPTLFGGHPNGATPAIQTKPVREGAPDGKFSFKRRRNCVYRAPINHINFPPVPTFVVPAAPISTTSSTNTVPSTPVVIAAPVVAPRPIEETVPASIRFYETFLPNTSGQVRSIGFARRRCGRGGRILFDRLPRNSGEGASMDPWAEYCVADSSRTFRARQSSLGTEEETEEHTPRELYFARSNRVQFNDDDREREWASHYRPSAWHNDTVTEDDRPSEKFDDLSKASNHEQNQQQQKGTKLAMKVEEKEENTDSEVERMDVDGQEDEAQITVSSEPKDTVVMMEMMNGGTNGCNGNAAAAKEKKEGGDDRKNEDEVDDMDMDHESHRHHHQQSQKIQVQVEKFRHIMTNGMSKLKPLQEHSPPLLSGNGRAGREEPTAVLPAKMSATVSETEDWREPSGSPSESNSSTEWSNYTSSQTALAVMKKQQQQRVLLNNDADDEEQQSPDRRVGGGGGGPRDHSIKDTMSTVTMLDRNNKTYMMPSTIGM